MTTTQLTFSPLLAGTVLAVLVLSAAAAGGGGRARAVWLALVAVAWLLVNKPMEGRVLLVLSPTHGLTAGDLCGFAALGLAVYFWLREGDPPGGR